MWSNYVGERRILYPVYWRSRPANAAKTDRRATGMLELFIPRLQVGVGYHKLGALPTVWTPRLSPSHNLVPWYH